jgi:hypothetical protein
MSKLSARLVTFASKFGQVAGASSFFAPAYGCKVLQITFTTKEQAQAFNQRSVLMPWGFYSWSCQGRSVLLPLYQAS